MFLFSLWGQTPMWSVQITPHKWILFHNTLYFSTHPDIDLLMFFPYLYSFLSLCSGTKCYENSFFLYNSFCKELGILQITGRWVGYSTLERLFSLCFLYGVRPHKFLGFFTVPGGTLLDIESYLSISIINSFRLSRIRPQCFHNISISHKSRL